MMENLIIPCKTIPRISSNKIKSIPFELSLKSDKATIFLPQKNSLKFHDAHLNSLCKNGLLRQAITVIDANSQRGSKLEPLTYINLLQSCIDTNSIQLGRELHARIGLVNEANPFVDTKLVSMYAKCGFLDDARKVFDGMREKNLYTWSAMIGACSREQRWKEVVDLFFLMMGDGVVPDDFLFPKILQACGNCEDFETAKLIHSVVVRYGMSCFIRVNNSILAVYMKCGKLSLARKFFENMTDRDRVSWNAIISGYCQKGENIDEARRLFDAMSRNGVEPDLVTWNIMISSCSESGNCDVAMELMRKMENSGIKPDVYTWTSMISGFAHSNKTNQALELFKEMLLAGAEPNGITIVSAISACASLKSINKGMEVHSIAVKKGFANDLLVANTLIDMYSKCGKLESAWNVFDSILERDVYTWNSMIGGYCQAGYCGKAYELFTKMRESDVLPNVITWNVMISGCIQNGDEDQAMNLFHIMEKEGKIKRNTASWNSLIAGYQNLGQKNKALGIFRQMQSFYFSPNSVTILSVLPACANLVGEKKVKEIHCCILRRNLENELPVANSFIDTYAKSGNIKYSRTIFDTMLSKDIISWNSVIAGYVLHGCSDLALRLFDWMKKLGIRPNRGTLVSIINAYSLAGMVDKGRETFLSITKEYQIIPSLDHYSAMVDLYGRSGRLGEAMDFIEDMPLEPNSSIWGNLLTACRIHGSLRLATQAGESLIKLDPGNYLIHRMIVQAYALCGKSENALKLKRLEKENVTKKNLGQCWIEVNNTVHSFVSGDLSKSNYLYVWIKSITEKIKRHHLHHQLGIDEEQKEEIGGFHSEKIAFAFGLIGSSNIPKSIRIVKNLRMCGECHRTAKYISVAYGCEIYLSDSKCLHHFQDGHCSCGDYW